jgi:hypothetical protein
MSLFQFTVAKVNGNLLMKTSIMSVGAYINVVITADVTTMDQQKFWSLSLVIVHQ